MFGRILTPDFVADVISDIGLLRIISSKQRRLLLLKSPDKLYRTNFIFFLTSSWIFKDIRCNVSMRGQG
jgi:hypothetical protein